jgi:hypothetical protein
MKRLFRSFLKFVIILLYPVVVVLLIAVSVVLFLRMRDIDSAMNTYDDIYEDFDIKGSRQGSISNAMDDMYEIVDDLYGEIESREETIADLNTNIENEKKNGYGEIQGSILAFVTEGRSLGSYQRVCAETVENPDKQYCVSVSAIQKQYSLVVPEGQYYVSAQLQSADQSASKAYYTEFVQCIGDETQSNCNANLSNNNVLVEVTSSETVQNVDPIDWQTQGINLRDALEE